MQFDFLGKDSIRYENTVEVEPPVYNAILKFQKGEKMFTLFDILPIRLRSLSICFSQLSGKKPSEELFDKLDTSTLNSHLKELMPNLTAKVFRTFNASFTLDDMVKKSFEISAQTDCRQK
jgi:DNA topoisomerase I